MKKWLILSMISIMFLLVGCTQVYRFNFETPESITILKDEGMCENYQDYHPIVLTDSAEIDAFMSELASWRYEEERGLNLDLCGLSFVISFNDTVIEVVNMNYFYIQGDPMLYKFVQGNLDFLNLLDWQLVTQE